MPSTRPPKILDRNNDDSNRVHDINGKPAPLQSVGFFCGTDVIELSVKFVDIQGYQRVPLILFGADLGDTFTFLDILRSSVADNYQYSHITAIPEFISGAYFTFTGPGTLHYNFGVNRYGTFDPAEANTEVEGVMVSTYGFEPDGVYDQLAASTGGVPNTYNFGRVG